MMRAVALDRERIIGEAIALLDESGLGGVTLRKLAVRLGVQAPTLYWHIRNKAELINALADVILSEPLQAMDRPEEGRPWREWLIEAAQRQRRAMLAHPDGARVVAAAHTSPTLSALSEQTMRTLVECGVPLREARLTVLVTQKFTLGYVLEEQSPPPETEGFDLDAFTARYPTIVAGITEYFQDGRTVEDLFRDSLKLILK
jgi:TetR/AcrR family transcriptional regulator, tetracycline repressor protein